MPGQSQRRNIFLLQVGLPNTGAGFRNVESPSSGLTLGSIILFLWCLVYSSRSKRYFGFVNALLSFLRCWIVYRSFHLLKSICSEGTRLYFVCCLNSFLMKSDSLPLGTAFVLFFSFSFAMLC